MEVEDQISKVGKKERADPLLQVKYGVSIDPSTPHEARKDRMRHDVSALKLTIDCIVCQETEG